MAVVVMGTIAVAAAVIVAVDALMRLLPLLIVALAVWAVLRVGGRHQRRGRARSVPAQPPARQPPVRPVTAARTADAYPGRWVMVPVWIGPMTPPPRHPVIDGEVLGEDGVQ